MKNIIILYHGDCRDGFSGAWVAWKKFGAKADYFGLKYGLNNSVSLPNGLKNKTVYLIDFGLKGGNQMKNLVKNNQKVVVLDHHHDAENFAKMAYDYRLELNHSGAVIAWQYFYPKKTVPLLLKYVEDLDIWKRKLPHTFAVSDYLDLFDMNFANWNLLASQLEKFRSRQKIFKDGELLLRYENKKIQELVEKNAELVDFCGIRTLAVNSPNWASQIGNILSNKLPPMAIVWSKRGSNIYVSLRSNGKKDVSELARRFGGGGHKAAAGFSLDSFKDIPWRSLEK